MVDDTHATTVERFFARLAWHAEQGSLVKLVLAKHQGAEADLVRVTVRPLLLRDQPQLSFLYTYTSRDVTRNHPVAEGQA